MDAKQELTIILDDCKLISDRFNAYQKYEIAGHILNYGIIVPPIGVGKVVWCLNGNQIIKAVVTGLRFSQTKDGIKCGLTLIDVDGDKMVCSAADIGQIIFFTEKEAIQVLRTQKTIYDICKKECEE